MSRIHEYNMGTSVCSDTCWKNAKDSYNKQMENYNLFYNDTSEVEKPTGTFPEFALEHTNLRGRSGFGLTDDYLVDNYSALRNDPKSLTHDKCQTQIFERIFTACPLLKGSTGDIEKELDILSGNDTNMYKCKKNIMEKQLNNTYPLLDCLKEFQKPENIVPEWTNGGEDTRSYINRVNFNKKCFNK